MALVGSGRMAVTRPYLYRNIKLALARSLFAIAFIAIIQLVSNFFLFLFNFLILMSIRLLNVMNTRSSRCATK